MNQSFSKIKSFISLRGLFSATAIGLLGFSSMSQAVINFSVDTFTADELTVTFTPGSELSGVTPAALDTDLLIYGMLSGEQASGWYLNLVPTPFSTSLTVGGKEMTGNAGNLTVLGGKVRLTNGSALVSGDSIGGASTTVSWSGVGSFDPTKVDTFVLSWGIASGFSAPGTIQSSTAIPEPQVSAALVGVLFLGLAYWQRKRRQ